MSGASSKPLTALLGLPNIGFKSAQSDENGGFIVRVKRVRRKELNAINVAVILANLTGQPGATIRLQH